MAVIDTEKKIAIVATSGFEESHMTAIQKALTQAGLTYKLVAPEQGLVNGWQGTGWGHYYPVDTTINNALGSDYDALILIGGERSTSKLKQNPHMRRIVNHFVAAGKPLSAIGDGVSLLALNTQGTDKIVSAPEASREELKTAGLSVSANEQEQDDNILTAAGVDIESWAQSTVTLIQNDPQAWLEEAA